MIIDPFRFAKRAQQLNTIVQLMPVGRLEGVIAQESQLNLLLNGGRNENNRLVLSGEINGTVKVICQVCLDIVEYPVDITFRLLPVISEEQAEKLNQNIEPIIIEDDKLELDELVNNELILAMPVAICHRDVDGKDCADKDNFTVGEIEHQTKSSPFDVLKNI